MSLTRALRGPGRDGVRGRVGHGDGRGPRPRGTAGRRPGQAGGVRAVGVDETAFLKGNAHRHTTFVTGIVDIDLRRLLYIASGRSGPVLAQWITGQNPDWWAGLAVASLDPFRGYVPPCPRPCPTRPGCWTRGCCTDR